MVANLRVSFILIPILWVFGGCDAEPEPEGKTVNTREGAERPYTRGSGNSRPRTTNNSVSEDATAENLNLVAYNEHIAPLMEHQGCFNCHGQSGVPPVIDGYTTAATDRVVMAITGGAMPPSGPLSTKAMELLKAWRDGGYLESLPVSQTTAQTQTETPASEPVAAPANNNNGTTTPPENVELPPVEDNGVYFVNHIMPLMETYQCLNCHDAGGLQMDLSTYDLVKASNAVDSVVQGRMPLGRKVTEEHAALFQAWLDGGYLFEKPGSNGEPDAVVVEDNDAPTPPPPPPPNPGDQPQEETPPIPDIGEKVTYLDDIEPLLKKHNCTLCHTTGGNPPELTSYTLVKDANTVASVVSGAMPKGSEMPDEEIQVFVRWQEDGYLEGPRSDTPAPDKDPYALCDSPNYLPMGLRRLSALEYQNTIEAITGLTWAQLDLAPPPLDTSIEGFDNDRNNNKVTQNSADYYFANAEKIAAKMVESTATMNRYCGGASGAACATALISNFGQEAFRQPLDSSVISRLTATYNSVNSSWGHEEGLKAVIESILMAPQASYRFEVGTAGAGGLHQLGQYEIASVLSYMFTASPPDAELYRAAAAGELSDPANRESQATRLMASEQFIDLGTEFILSWLGIKNIEGVTKDPNIFPSFTAGLKSSFKAEARLFTEAAYRDDASPKVFLNGKYTFLDSTLASYYGIPANGDWGRVSLEGTPRSGIFSQGAFTASHSLPLHSSPIQRGVVLATRVMCQHLPEPPIDVAPLEAIDGQNLSQRQKVTEHSSNPSCRGCHQFIDPYGFSLENFDGVGQFQTVDNGHPVDASGELPLDEAKILFNNFEEMASELAETKQYEACFVEQMQRFSFGISKKEINACHVKDIVRAFNAGGPKTIQQLYVAFVKSDYFILRKSDDVTP